ncbi:uncharacterized protein LOC128668852 [Microplitis demolitor]|uniref:uncharacterized protein LOC128668852 n=1 Tax=Microplitis demolitor TaxID=69319 RepID=UPI00235B5E63|nr:uncharacterized protein LOC128668852 [Microplitis demolitor]
MTDISRLKRQRGYIQATVTNLKKYLDQADVYPSTHNLHLIQSMLDTAVKAFEKFSSIQNSLEQLDEKEIDNRIAYVQNYTVERLCALKLIDELSPASVNIVNQPQPVATTVVETKAAVTLPAITLPSFDGTPEKWTAFYGLFLTLIDQENLPNVKKLNYLRASLTGKAARTIESLEFTDGNYAVALKILKEKYENVRRMTQRHWAILREYPRLAKDTPTAINDLIDVFSQHTRALENLKAPVSFWDIPIIDLILFKLNSNTAWQWELTLNDQTIPAYQDLLKFLGRRANCADTMQHDNNQRKETSRSHPQSLFTHSNNQFYRPSHARNGDGRSSSCKEPHLLYTCMKFKSLTVEERRKIVSEAHLCFNCFGRGHGSAACNSQMTYRKCFKRHNTLLHLQQHYPATELSQYNQSNPNENRKTTLVLNAMSNDIMVTAVLDVLDKDRRPIQCRGLLDTCSTTNFITQRLADILKLPKTTCNIPIGALNSMTTYCNKLTTATIKSRINNYKKTLTFLIVLDISHVVPDQPIQRNLIKIPGNIKLADPNFHKPAPVYMLLGAGTTLSLLSIGQIKLTLPYQQEMLLQKTLLGWIIGGSAPASKPIQSKCHVTATFHEFDLEKFWKVEECLSFNKFTNDEEEFEQHFRKHIDRDSDGRYIVALPFKPHSPKLGKSYHLALKRFENTERRLSKTSGQTEAYNGILNDCLKQNHMSHIQCNPTDIESYYLPHHAVIKETSMTTKLRVVFDGSFKITTGVSLNDVLYTGPTIQPDLCTTLLRFRLHPIVITRDLKRMYLQFLVRKQD